MIIKQVEIAKLVGVSTGFISRVLSKTDPLKPSWKTAKKLAKATNTDPVLWLEGTPDQIKAGIKNNNQPPGE
ncbi:MAG: helix-turn-helix transcriptional regulator [Deltaproteobacteria bacterium]|uniref:helix-turn-helix domain-containing protein n=1 Tax=Desulfobacula sp. TaxID=2593537 RepID=UPI00198A4C33|nr:helix-turn-helix transcriptional regulator [Candidatus Desulfobacula maris]MBL6992305.1 helix-turn-helix transcriptional regulator [Desulfobacula sp.]